MDHTQAVLQPTVMRARTMVRARAGSDFADGEDDSRPGKWEYQLRVRDDAKSMGVSTDVLG